MAPIEGDIALTPITPDDIADCLSLVREAGWNQTEADWRFMLSVGRSAGIRGPDNRLVATSIVLAYPPAIGWIGMVLVTTACRKQGYATRLLDAAIAWCREAGLTPTLDATPAGREVYRRLGFADGPAIERWRGMGAGTSTVHRDTDLDLAIGLDRAAFGADRSALLVDLARRGDAPAFRAPDAVLLARRGRTATQLGPLLAADEATATSLCSGALDAVAGPVLIDVPVRETALRQLLSARGFVVERAFTRMSLGTPAPMGQAMRAIAGPELG